MEKIVIHTDKAASGKVPLSQAIQIGEWLHCSGQLPIDPKTGELVPGGAAEQTRRDYRESKSCVRGGRYFLEKRRKSHYLHGRSGGSAGNERRVRGILRDGRPTGANDFSGVKNHRRRETRNRTAGVHPPIISIPR